MPTPQPTTPLTTATDAPILGANDLAFMGRRMRGQIDTAAGGAIAGLSRRMGGDTSSPFFGFQSSLIRGNAAASAAEAESNLRYQNAKDGRDYGLRNRELDQGDIRLRQGQQALDQGQAQFDASLRLQQQESDRSDFLRRFQALLGTNGTASGQRAANMLFRGFYQPNPFGSTSTWTGLNLGGAGASPLAGAASWGAGRG